MDMLTILIFVLGGSLGVAALYVRYGRHGDVDSDAVHQLVANLRAIDVARQARLATVGSPEPVLQCGYLTLFEDRIEVASTPPVTIRLDALVSASAPRAVAVAPRFSLGERELMLCWRWRPQDEPVTLRGWVWDPDTWVTTIAVLRGRRRSSTRASSDGW